MKDLHHALTERTDCERSANRDEKGRFGPVNKAATDRGSKSIIKRALEGSNLPADMVRDAVVLYRAYLRDLPIATANIRALVASRVRHQLVATHLAGEATAAGLTTPAGIKLLEASRAHDKLQAQLSVTVLDHVAKALAAAPRETSIDRVRREAEADLRAIEGGRK